MVILEWKPEHYSDMGMLLSNCDNVYSATVPEAIQQLAALISANNDKRLEFISLKEDVQLFFLYYLFPRIFINFSSAFMYSSTFYALGSIKLDSKTRK